MSIVSRVGFLRSGFILAVLKDSRTRPEVRKELIGGEKWQVVARDGLEELGEDRVKGKGGGVVIRNYSVDIFGGERDKVGKNRGGNRVGEDGGRG